MKAHVLLVLIPTVVLLAGCNFTLAADITPPPDYVSPTPLPTLGALYPASAPDTQAGAAIFAQDCAACHGSKGLGDGPQSMQLPVAVPGLGLPDVARSASPAAWFKTVTQGNLDRFMPPFVGALSDQQRWDVISYVLTLHTTPEQLTRGRSLVEANCADCAGKFGAQNKMAALSEDDLADIVKNGNAEIAAFGSNFGDEEAHAAAAYLRTLTFASSPPAAEASTASAAGLPTLAAESAATPAGTGTITGSIQVPASARPDGLTVTLRGFDHAPDQTSGPQEVLTLSTIAGTDGSYSFENIFMPLNRIFLAEVEYAGIQYRSNFGVAAADANRIDLPPLKAYEASGDLSLLRVDQIHIYTDFATAGTVQVLEIFAFSNASDRSVRISTDGLSIPFIKLPDGALNPGYEAGQDSAPFFSAGKGLAVVPSEKPYSIIAFFNLPYDQKLEIDQPVVIDAPSILLLVPDGMKVDGRQFASMGLQVIQSHNYQEFSANDLRAGESLRFAVTGRPRNTSATGLDSRQGFLIGGGVLGLAFIIGGVFLFMRDRRGRLSARNEADFDSAEDVMDAILALDDLHRAGKIPEQAYQVRRDELKEILRQLA